MKRRGKDHKWEIRKYYGDLALYAHCSCGFQYNCSSGLKDNPLVQVPTRIYPFCPSCGARKKEFNDMPIEILNKYSWESQ